ncbi:unnamed protein product [Boreogadus saida]
MSRTAAVTRTRQCRRHFCSSSLEVGCGRLELLNFIVWIEGGDGSSSVPRDKDLALQDRDLAPPNPD